MSRLLASIWRDVCPPVLDRLISRAGGRGQRPPEDPEPTLSTQDRHSATLSTGHRLEHRGTEADLGVVLQVLYRRDYSFRRLRRREEIEAFYSDCADPLILDCGANIGAATVWFHARYPKARIVSIEPDAANFRILSGNCGSLGNVSLVHGAVASFSGEVLLEDPGLGEWGYRTSSQSIGASSHRVPAHRIEDLMEVNPGTPFLLKIDIEGAESELFSRPSPVFDAFPIVVIELHDWMLPRMASSRSFLEWHTSSNRDLILADENVISISNRHLPDLHASAG